MKILWISLIVLLIAYATPINCPRYFVSNETAKENTICALENPEVVNLTRCGVDLACGPFVYEGEAACIKRHLANYSLVAGQACKNNFDCASNNCTKSVCEGITLGKDCNTTSQCDKKLYCGLGKKCAEAGKNCLSDGSGCLNNQVCFRNGTCVYFASLENKVPSDFPTACKSYYINEEGVCSDGPKLKTLGDYTCKDSKLCEYNEDNKEITMPCMCAKKNASVSHCLPGIQNINKTNVMFCLSL